MNIINKKFQIKSLTKTIFLIALSFWMAIFTLTYTNTIFFNPVNIKTRKNVAGIPSILNNSLQLKQEEFFRNLDGIYIIDTEMETLYYGAKFEEFIVFCFDINKKLIYCDRNNKDKYHISLATGNENSVIIPISKIQNLKKINSKTHYFVPVHNHPYSEASNKKGEGPVHLPSLADLNNENIKSITDPNYWFSIVWADWRTFLSFNSWFPHFYTWKEQKYFSSVEYNNQKYNVGNIFDHFDIKRIYTIYD